MDSESPWLATRMVCAWATTLDAASAANKAVMAIFFWNVMQCSWWVKGGGRYKEKRCRYLVLRQSVGSGIACSIRLACSAAPSGRMSSLKS